MCRFADRVIDLLRVFNFSLAFNYPIAQGRFRAVAKISDLAATRIARPTLILILDLDGATRLRPVGPNAVPLPPALCRQNLFHVCTLYPESPGRALDDGPGGPGP